MNNDSKATMLGLLLAMSTAVGDAFAHLGPDGVDWSKPTFWIGLVIAALLGVKGYYTNKGTTTPQVVVQSTGNDSTTNVEVKPVTEKPS